MPPVCQLHEGRTQSGHSVHICGMSELSERKLWVSAHSKMLPDASSLVLFSSVQSLSCPTLCDPMDCSSPGFPVHHQLPEFTQTHVHCIGDAIQTSSSVIPFSSCLQSFPVSRSFQMSQFFTSGGQVLEFQLQHQYFQ